MTTIVGQDQTMKELERIFKIFLGSECEIKPHFILTGPSGCGKSLVINYLADKCKMNFLEVNAAQLTKEGISGNSLSKALSPMMQFQNKPSVVFVDEFDKLFISGNANTDLAHESTNGVQNEFLKVLEGGIASVFGDYGKYVQISTAKTLFVFAGAFNGELDITIDRLRMFGLKTEFLGRVGLVYNIMPLTLDNLYSILEQSVLLDQYIALFPDVDREKTILLIKAWLRDNYEHNTLGARVIHSLINQFFIKGGLPKPSEIKKITFQTTLSFRDDIGHQGMQDPNDMEDPI